MLALAQRMLMLLFCLFPSLILPPSIDQAELENERIDMQCENSVEHASLNIILDSLKSEIVNSSTKCFKSNHMIQDKDGNYHNSRSVTDVLLGNNRGLFSRERLEKLKHYAKKMLLVVK